MPKKNVEKKNKVNSTKAKTSNSSKNKNTVNKKSSNNKTVKDLKTKEVETKLEDTKEVVVEEATKEEVIKHEVKPSVVITKEGIGTPNCFTKLKQNIPFVIATCVCIILLGILIFVLCTKKVPKLSNGDEIVAKLNGKDITANELYENLKEEHGTDALINLIDEYITEKEVKVTDADKEYVKGVVDYYKQYAEYYQTDLISFLKEYVGLTDIKSESDFSDFVMKDYKKTLAVQNYVAEKAKEDDLVNYYKNNYSDTLTVRHILLEIDEDGKNEKDVKKKAEDLIKTLKNTKAEDLEKKFTELAKKNSDDTGSYSNGGLVENFSKSDVVEEFWNASVALKDGELSLEPVKSKYGYHIILKVSSTPVKEYEEIKDEVKIEYAKSLLSNDSTLQVSKWDELRKQYNLSIEDDFIKSTYEKTVNEATKTEE